MTADQVADRLAIADKLYKYCRSVDRLDVPLGHTCFHEDAVADFPTFKGTGRGWIDFICEEHRNFLHHSHQVTNVIIDLHDAAHAGSEAYVTAKLRQMDGDTLIEREFCARYVDLWSKRPNESGEAEWAIDQRDCIVDFSATREVTSLGEDPRARRDAADISYAVLKGL